MGEKAFCDYYIELGNATEAAIRAGYSGKTAASMGAENLRKLKIKEYIEKRLKEIESARTADMKEVQEFWAEQIRNKEAKDADRIKASELIAKTYGAFLERVEHSGEVTEIKVDYGDSDG